MFANISPFGIRGFSLSQCSSYYSLKLIKFTLKKLLKSTHLTMIDFFKGIFSYNKLTPAGNHEKYTKIYNPYFLRRKLRTRTRHFKILPYPFRIPYPGFNTNFFRTPTRTKSLSPSYLRTTKSKFTRSPYIFLSRT